MDIKEEWKDIINILIVVIFRLFPLREHFLHYSNTSQTKPNLLV